MFTKLKIFFIFRVRTRKISVKIVEVLKQMFEAGSDCTVFEQKR